MVWYDFCWLSWNLTKWKPTKKDPENNEFQNLEELGHLKGTGLLQWTRFFWTGAGVATISSASRASTCYSGGDSCCDWISWRCSNWCPIGSLRSVGSGMPWTTTICTHTKLGLFGKVLSYFEAKHIMSRSRGKPRICEWFDICHSMDG